MDKCNLHTILRLPTGIFYAQGVKTNVLFFDRGHTEKGNTTGVWYYDLRNEMPSFGKRTPLTTAHFSDFEDAYTAKDRSTVKDKRLSYFSREEIHDTGDSLDLGLMQPEAETIDWETYDPAEQASEAADLLEEASDLLRSLAKDLTLAKGNNGKSEKDTPD